MPQMMSNDGFVLHDAISGSGRGGGCSGWDCEVLALLVCHLSVGQFIMTAKWQAMMCCVCVCVECVSSLVY